SMVMSLRLMPWLPTSNRFYVNYLRRAHEACAIEARCQPAHIHIPVESPRHDRGKEVVVSLFLKAARSAPIVTQVAPAMGSAQASAPPGSSADSIDWKAVDAAVGRPAVVQAGDVHRFNFPRSDLHVTAAGVPVKPALALGGWVAMKAASGGVIATGDLVLTEDEINPVIMTLQRGGVEQTAIHHHL